MNEWQAAKAALREDQIEQFARRIQSIAERWKGVNGGIYTIRAMALDMAHTLMDERALCVSNGNGNREDAVAAECEACQRGPEGETPHPSPVDYTEVVERLREDAKAKSEASKVYVQARYGENYDWTKPEQTISFQAAQVIEAQAAEIEKKRRQILRLCEDSEELTWERDEEAGRAKDLGKELGQWKERAEREHGLHLSACRSLGEALTAKEAAQARIAELEKERDEARKGMNTFFNLGQEAGRRADAAEARLADAVKVLDWIVSNPGAHSANMVTVADNALQTLSTGGDSHG